MDESSQTPVPPEADTSDTSPMWGTNTKLVVGMTIVALAGIVLSQIGPVLSPLALAFVLSYLLYPVIEGLAKRTRLKWRGAVNIIFIILVILLLSSLTASIIALINQFESLFDIIESFLNDLPTITQNFIDQGLTITIPFFNFEFDIREYIMGLNIDLLALSEQLLSAAQPILGQAGGILTKVATSVFGILGWAGFIMAIAYLSLGEAKQGSSFLERELRGMAYDYGRMTREMSRIWDAFLRGQMTVFLVSSTTMFILLSILDVRYALGLAVLAGLARFIPYVGQVGSAIVNALVAFFLAEGNHFGLEPFWYMLLVVGVAFFHDQLYDTLVMPRILGNALGVHPALVVVFALLATTWFGFVGLILAAPVIASIQLIAFYIIRKLLDRNPWPDPEPPPKEKNQIVKDIATAVQGWVTTSYAQIGKVFRKNEPREESDHDKS